MKISIITVNYNNYSGLKHTLESVKSQFCTHYQQIVIDGGSSDGSADLLEKYKDIIDYGVSEKDSGIFNAMNKGIANATGEYLLFLNSGDYLLNEHVIANALPYLTGEDFISGDTICLRSDGTKAKWCSPRNLSAFVLVRYALSHQSTFIKADLLRKRPYREDLRIASDWEQELYELLFNNATYKAMPIEICCFGEDGISRTNLKETDVERQKVYNEYFTHRMLENLLGCNELVQIVNHVERDSSLYKWMLLGVKISRKLHNILFKHKK